MFKKDRVKSLELDLWNEKERHFVIFILNRKMQDKDTTTFETK